MTSIDIACATDRRYLAHCAVMLRSLLSAATDARVRVSLLHGPDMPAHDLRRVEQMVVALGGSVLLHRIEDADVSGLPDWGRIPVTMWYRILLPELLPDVERVLYLDIDTLAIVSPAPLWEADLTGYYVGAVTNVPERHMLGHARDLGLAGPEAYFNSGVLLMNLELMRRDRCSDALRECAIGRRDELLWPDQDALNLVLGERRLALHPRWNLMNSIRSFPWARELLDPEAVDEAIERPGIVHFEGPRQNKPWHVLCDHPMRDAYFRHRRATPWPRCRRQGMTPANLARLAAGRVGVSAAR